MSEELRSEKRVDFEIIREINEVFSEALTSEEGLK